MGTRCKFKTNNKNLNFSTQFCIRSISNGFSATDCSEVSLNGSEYDSSVDYNSIDKSDILNIYKYFVNKNNIKKCLVLFKKVLLFSWVLVAL